MRSHSSRAARPITTQVGKLRDDRIDVFARYYAKFVQAYAQQGIRIDALTLLNEPGIDVVYPAMDISVDQQQKLAVAIKKYVTGTQLYVHDFNFWGLARPEQHRDQELLPHLRRPASTSGGRRDRFPPVLG